MAAEPVSFAMPGQLLSFEQACQPSASFQATEDSPASDYLVHSWEAPTCASGCCAGKFASEHASCAFAQPGGVAFLDAGTAGVFSAHDMHSFDRVDKVESIRVPGAYP